MKVNRRIIIGGAFLIVFGVVAFLNFGRTITPYVSFAEARGSERAVQVAGFPDHAGASFDMEKGMFLFTMTNEEGEDMSVCYKGAEPGNFSQAQSVVVIGRYDEGMFNASQILVKCPSKYESQGTEHPGGAGAKPDGANAVATSAAETD
jgi:cytochrome c-type biogenesis protein CcmE